MVGTADTMDVWNRGPALDGTMERLLKSFTICKGPYIPGGRWRGPMPGQNVIALTKTC